jgi:hypothetical protein
MYRCLCLVLPILILRQNAMLLTFFQTLREIRNWPIFASCHQYFLSLKVRTEAVALHAEEACRGNYGTVTLIFNLCSSWRWEVVIFKCAEIFFLCNVSHGWNAWTYKTKLLIVFGLRNSNRSKVIDVQTNKLLWATEVVHVLCYAWRSCLLTKCAYFVFRSVEMLMAQVCYLIYVIMIDRIQLYVLCASEIGSHKYSVWLCMQCCLQLRAIILPVVSYGCEIWLLTLREERRLWVFENRAPRRIFGPKWDEVTGEWRKLRNEELNDLYCSPDITQVNK